MKTTYFTGYITSTTRNGNFHSIWQNPNNLVPGKKYLVEEYSTWVSRNGNGGSSYSSYETYYRVYDPNTKKLISDREWTSVFKDSVPKSCLHKTLVYVDRESEVKQCDSCFKKFMENRTLKAVK